MIYKTRNAVNQLNKYYLDKASKFVNQRTELFSTTLKRLSHRHICLGITGLSQSGKSTFVTSIRRQLAWPVGDN